MTARQAPPFHPDVIAALQSWLHDVRPTEYEWFGRLVQKHLGEEEFERLRTIAGGLPDLARCMAVSVDGESWSLIAPTRVGPSRRKPFTGSVVVIPAVEIGRAHV